MSFYIQAPDSECSDYQTHRLTSSLTSVYAKNPQRRALFRWKLSGMPGGLITSTRLPWIYFGTNMSATRRPPWLTVHPKRRLEDDPGLMEIAKYIRENCGGDSSWVAHRPPRTVEINLRIWIIIIVYRIKYICNDWVIVVVVVGTLTTATGARTIYFNWVYFTCNSNRCLTP